MRHSFTTLFLAGLVLASAFPTARAQIVDQSNYSFQGAFSSANVWTGQTFIPSAHTSAGGGFFLQSGPNGFAGTLNVELWSDVASDVGATLLAFGNAPISFTNYQQGMVDVFWSAVAVTPGNQYFLTMNGGGNTGDLYTTASFSDPYPSGNLWYQNYNGGSDTSPYVASYGPSDLAFEEFTAPIVTTPEPASVVLMASGLLGVVGVTRIRRRLL